MISTDSGNTSSMTWAGYTFTEQVSMTNVPGLNFGARSDNTPLRADIATHNTMVSHVSNSSSLTISTPGREKSRLVLLYPFTGRLLANSAAQKAPNRPNPYIPTFMRLCYHKVASTDNRTRVQSPGYSIVLPIMVFCTRRVTVT